MKNVVIRPDQQAAIQEAEGCRLASQSNNETRYPSLKNMLRVTDEPKAGKLESGDLQLAAFHREALRLKPSYWEWDMTTPNTALYRSRRRRG